MSKAPRPPRFPPPQFPPHRPKLFATTPPAIFPVILGLMGTVLALRRAEEAMGAAAPLVELLAGAVLALWAFAIVALKAKVIRRPSVLWQDLRPLPGRAGLAAASMSGMLAGALLAPYSPVLAEVLLFASLLAHAILASMLILLLRGEPPEARVVNPTLHLSFVGFIVAAAPLAQLGWTGHATVLLMGTLAVAVVIWTLSALDLMRHRPPAVLRPLLAIHLAPASLFAITATALNLPGLTTGFTALALGLGVLLLALSPWLTASGFSPLWGAFTFPLAALASALVVQGGLIGMIGAGLAVLALAVNGLIGWRVLKLWPGNRLAQKTNAAEA